MASPKVLYCVMGIQISVFVLLMGYFICDKQYLKLTQFMHQLKAKQVQEKKCIQLDDIGQDIQLVLGGPSDK